MDIFNSILPFILENWIIILSFFAISILYSSVGFGGGSSYLAILSLLGVAFLQVRAIALLCNITVVGSNIIGFTKLKQYQWKKVLPLIIMSVPMAYFGGKIIIEKKIFILFLATVLIIISLFMVFSKNVSSKEISFKSKVINNYSIGGIIGFISGLVGIGGGIFLAPFLYQANWDTPKKIAAVSSLFILVNSIAGLLGQFQNPNFKLDYDLSITLIIAVLIGSQIGAKFRNTIISPLLLKKLTAVIVFVAGLRLIWKYLS